MRRGVAARLITPDRPVWMSGYGSRDRESEAVHGGLLVKALALDSGDGPVVIVTSDLLYFSDGPRFVLGHANHVRHYIPSRSVRLSGGYEAESHFYHRVPSAYDASAEDVLAEAARRMLG